MSQVHELANTKVGPYRVQDCIGVGGMGEVFRALDERLERPVALKQIRAESAEKSHARQRFRREARAAARLNHPNIVTLHDIFSHEDGDWIVMEWVNGESLDQVVARNPHNLDESLALAIQLVDALSAAHAEGIVHRDLKAKNILITPERQLKVLDFGLAKELLMGHGETTSLTADGQILGTPYAMSPEQAMGHKVDLRSDLFSLGALLYEMFTGTHPFKAQTTIETLRRVFGHHPTPISELRPEFPEGLSDLIGRLLEKEVTHRPNSAVEVAATLRRLKAEIKLPSHEDQNSATTSPESTTLASGTRPLRSVNERRHVTVLCCELISRDDPSESLDPQRLFATIGRFESDIQRLEEEFEGHVGNSLGHRQVLYFGFPRAHEDDATRAVRAALFLLGRYQNLKASSDEVPSLTLRAAIHTGPAVILSSTPQKQLILGKTLDLTGGLLKQTLPGALVVSAATHQLITGHFETESLGLAKDPRTRDSNEVFRIRGSREDSGEWREPDPTPLIGREHELGILTDRFVRARQSRGQVVLLSGDAGIGKSRLVRALRDHTESQCRWLTATGISFATSTSFQPIVSMLHRWFRLGEEACSSDQLSRLVEELSHFGLVEPETLSLFSDLLSLPSEGRFPPLALTAQKKREKTMEALTELLIRGAKKEPFVLVVEDLHWLDPSTLEWLGLLIQRTKLHPLLLVLTYRLEFESPWPTEPHMTRLHLARLPGAEASDLLKELSGGRPLPDEVRKQILAKTDGIPLFVEELFKNVLESGLLTERGGRYELDGPIEEISIPTTLRDSLTARLDRLGAAKETAQLAAALGREFSYQVLSRISPLEDSALTKALESLKNAELILQKGFSKRRRFIFKHALIQDSAYESLLERERRGIHERIALILETEFHKRVSTQPEVLAHHHLKAGAKDRAVSYFSQAGESSAQRSANREAMAHFRKGLEVLEDLPGSSSRQKMHLSVLIGLGGALMAVEGLGAPEAGEIFSQAQRDSEDIGTAPDLFWAVRGLWLFYAVRGEYSKAVEIGHQQLRLAEVTGEPPLLITALFEVGAASFKLGHLSLARRYLERGISTDSANRQETFLQAIEDPGMNCLAQNGLVLWLQGFPEAGLKSSQDAVAFSHQISHIFSLVPAMLFLAWQHHFRGDAEALLELASEAVTLSEELGFWWLHMGNILLGWALCTYADSESSERSIFVDEGLDRMRHGLAQWQAGGALIDVGCLTYLLADVLFREGDLDGAATEVDKALEIIEKTEENFWKPEILRLQGEISLAIAPSSPGGDGRQESIAEEKFQESLALSKQQGAKSLELRVTMSIARLWHQQGRTAQAAAMLSSLYDEFTEGSATADHREARNLLSMLNPSK